MICFRHMCESFEYSFLNEKNQTQSALWKWWHYKKLLMLKISLLFKKRKTLFKNMFKFITRKFKALIFRIIILKVKISLPFMQKTQTILVSFFKTAISHSKKFPQALLFSNNLLTSPLNNNNSNKVSHLLILISGNKEEGKPINFKWIKALPSKIKIKMKQLFLINQWITMMEITKELDLNLFQWLITPCKIIILRTGITLFLPNLSFQCNHRIMVLNSIDTLFIVK